MGNAGTNAASETSPRGRCTQPQLIHSSPSSRGEDNSFPGRAQALVSQASMGESAEAVFRARRSQGLYQWLTFHEDIPRARHSASSYKLYLTQSSQYPMSWGPVIGKTLRQGTERKWLTDLRGNGRKYGWGEWGSETGKRRWSINGALSST